MKKSILTVAVAVAALMGTAYAGNNNNLNTQMSVTSSVGSSTFSQSNASRPNQASMHWSTAQAHNGVAVVGGGIAGNGIGGSGLEGDVAPFGYGGAVGTGAVTAGTTKDKVGGFGAGGATAAAGQLGSGDITVTQNLNGQTLAGGHVTGSLTSNSQVYTNVATGVALTGTGHGESGSFAGAANVAYAEGNAVSGANIIGPVSGAAASTKTFNGSISGTLTWKNTSENQGRVSYTAAGISQGAGNTNAVVNLNQHVKNRDNVLNQPE